jgi:ATP-dependent 26S proteasome regulatory subunit
MLELLNQMDGFDALSEVKVGGAGAGVRSQAGIETSD